MKPFELRKTVLTDPRFDTIVADIPDNSLFDAKVRDAFEIYLEAYADSLSAVLSTTLAVDNELAFRAKTEAREGVSRNRLLTGELEIRAQKSKSTWFSFTLLMMVWALMIAAEWCLNRGVLPWIVGATGFAAAALAGAPSLTPVIFDRVLGALFGDAPWALGAPQPASRKLLLATVGVINLLAVALVGECRGVVAVLKALIADVPLSTHQAALVDSALVLLSLALAVDAAVIFLYASQELVEVLEKDQSTGALMAARAAQHELDSAVQDAERDSAAAVERYSDRDRQISCIKAEFMADRRLLIASRMARIVEGKDLHSIVEIQEKSQIFRVAGAA